VCLAVDLDVNSHDLMPRGLDRVLAELARRPIGRCRRAGRRRTPGAIPSFEQERNSCAVNVGLEEAPRRFH
jgi:hypothetical protein